MNWQARMSGDTVVSKMIESLGTVLDYRMNRANVKEIRLLEELRCTDAYFTSCPCVLDSVSRSRRR